LWLSFGVYIKVRIINELSRTRLASLAQSLPVDQNIIHTSRRKRLPICTTVWHTNRTPPASDNNQPLLSTVQRLVITQVLPPSTKRRTRNSRSPSARIQLKCCQHYPPKCTTRPYGQHSTPATRSKLRNPGVRAHCLFAPRVEFSFGSDQRSKARQSTHSRSEPAPRNGLSLSQRDCPLPGHLAKVNAPGLSLRLTAQSSPNSFDLTAPPRSPVSPRWREFIATDPLSGSL
jgi:hypothetical protein